MLCDSNSTSLMSVDNNSSSEQTKKFSPTKFTCSSWWEEVEAAQQIGSQESDADKETVAVTVKNIEIDTKISTSMDPAMLTFTNKIIVEEKNDDGDKDESDFQFLDRTIESNDSTTSNTREIKLEFLDSSNEYKYDRLVKEVKNIPFKRRLSGDSRSNSPISFFSIENEEVTNTDARSSEASKINPTHSATSSSSIVTSGRNNAKRRRCNQEIETRPDILSRRQKQIDYGKNTIGYDNYVKQIPRDKRSKDHPWTPPKHNKYSRRAFDGLVKIWRMKLHCFDPPNSDGRTNIHDDCESSDLSSENDD